MEQDLDGGEARLLAKVDLSTRPGEADFVAQLEDLGWRLFGEALDDGQRADLEALWTAAAEPEAGESEDEAVRAAWVSVLVAMLRDPAFGRV